MKSSKEFFSNSNNTARLNLCNQIIDESETFANTYKALRILHKLENEDLPALFELIGKDDQTAIDVILETMTKNHEADLAE